jgi:hypothetical protein
MMLLIAIAENPLIPPRDEFGLPAWLWVFHLLLPFTFALHAVFMNFALGGSIVIPALWVFGRRRGRNDLIDVARAALRIMPVAVSFTITTGVAVLLFVQVMYGQFFYTANILMGWHWLMILAYLMIGFYLVYVAEGLLRRGRIRWGIVALVIVALAFLSIAHVFNNNAILSLKPELWRAIHDGTAGVHARDATWTPRYLHSIIGSIAVSGLWLAAMGRLSRTLSADSRRVAVVIGLKIALIATLFQVMSGLWFFVALEASTQKALLTFSDPRALLWGLAAVGGVVALALLWQALQRPDDARAVWQPIALIGFVLIGMSAGREAVRIEHLSRIPGALYESADVRLQSGPLAVFLIALVLGLATLTVMLRWVWTSQPREVRP